jgi:hypothetical protein
MEVGRSVRMILFCRMLMSKPIPIFMLTLIVPGEVKVVLADFDVIFLPDKVLMSRI